MECHIYAEQFEILVFRLIVLMNVLLFKLSRTSTSLAIIGISLTIPNSAYFISTKASSVFNNFCIDINYHIIPVINNKLLSHLLEISELTIAEHIKCQLADPLFIIPRPIDILLSAEVYFNLFYA